MPHAVTIARRRWNDPSRPSLLIAHRSQQLLFRRVEASMRDLVDRARDGDRDAFEQLAGTVVKRMYSTAMLVLRDSDLASDAVQETLIDLWRKLPTLRDSQAFEAWLYRMLVRRCYAVARRTKRIQADVTEVDVEGGARSDEWLVDTRDEIER